jgi:hypothetical protein
MVTDERISLANEALRKRQLEYFASRPKTTDLGSRLVGKVDQRRDGFQGYSESPRDIPPIPSDVVELIKSKHGIPSFASLSSAHLVGDAKKSMEKAINGMGSWSAQQKAAPSCLSAMLMSASTSTTTGFGVGKTHLAKAAGYEAFSEIFWSGDVNSSFINWRGKFFTSTDIVQEDALSRIGKSKVVIIDDVGRETSIKFVAAVEQTAERQKRYFGVIDHCYRRKIPIIITSNLGRNEFIEAVGGAAFSRLLEMVRPEFMFNLAGVPDHRAKIGGWEAW